MGLLHRLVLSLSLLMVVDFALNAQDLDTLLSSLSEAKTTSSQPEPEDGTDVLSETEVPEAKTFDTTESSEVEPVVDTPNEPEEDTEPMAKNVVGVVPKNIVSNVVAKSEPVPTVVEPEAKADPMVAMPKLMPKTPIAPDMNDAVAKTGIPVSSKMTVAPTPLVAKSSVSSPVQIVDVHEGASQGLDTLNIDSAGNWLEKRIWYQKGEQLFEVIRNNLQKAADLRMQFVHEVNQVGQQIDDFYEDVSFQKGQVDEMLQAVLQALENQTEVRGGDLGSSERSLQSKVKIEQKSIEAISKDLQLIADLDEQIDKTMMKSFKEIDVCRGLETRAWNHFKEIGLELDDKKARVLYYEMENIHKNIEQKMTYLQNNLLPYLKNQLISKVNETMTQIKNSMQNLDHKGLNLQTLLQKDEHGDLLILKKREKLIEGEVEAAFKKEQALKEKEEKALKASDVWYCRVWCLIAPYVQPIASKVYEWIMIIVCCLQSIVCKIQEWICRLLGY